MRWYIAGFTGVGNRCCVNVGNMLYKVSFLTTVCLQEEACAIYAAKRCSALIGSPVRGNFTDRLIGTTRALTWGQVGGLQSRSEKVTSARLGYFKKALPNGRRGRRRARS